jgi:NAD(P) transhydrogenase
MARRSLSNVIFGGYGTRSTGGGKAMEITGTHTETTVDDVVQLLADAQRVVITPGYVHSNQPWFC